MSCKNVLSTEVLKSIRWILLKKPENFSSEHGKPLLRHSTFLRNCLGIHCLCSLRNFMPHLICSSSTPLLATPRDIKAAERENAKRKGYVQDLSPRLFSRGYGRSANRRRQNAPFCRYRRNIKICLCGTRARHPPKSGGVRRQKAVVRYAAIIN